MANRAALEARGDHPHRTEAPYVLPLDEQEINRLDFQHYMLRHTLRGNYAAPITNPHEILDVGSGTGRWALEMATHFPQSNVLGVDLTPPAPDAQAGLPDNLAFIQGDILAGLNFSDRSFDFTHMRLLLFSIPENRWPDVVRDLVRVTRPGGWVEIVETGPQQNAGPAMDQIVEWIRQASLKVGVNLMLGPRIGELLAPSGLINVVARGVALPIGAYGGRVGRMAETDVIGVISRARGMVTSMGIAAPATYDAAVAQAKADLDRNHSTLPFYIYYGQRPA
jgi:ubiquinone/menaquinone biosynthesis C-methylase UbiE